MFPIETPACDFRFKSLFMENNIIFFIQSKSLKHIKLIYIHVFILNDKNNCCSLHRPADLILFPIWLKKKHSQL